MTAPKSTPKPLTLAQGRKMLASLSDGERRRAAREFLSEARKLTEPLVPPHLREAEPADDTDAEPTAVGCFAKVRKILGR